MSSAKRGDVLFVFPSVAYHMPDVACTYHYGAGFVRAALSERSIPSDQYITDRPLTLHDMTEDILDRSPRIIGFTCYDTNFFLIDLLSRQLKERKPELKIIVGATAATFHDERILETCSAVDIAVRGEGEHICCELIPILLRGGNYGDIRGITYRNNGAIMRNPDGELVGDSTPGSLDILPSPYLSGAIPAELAMKIGLSTSRGCRGMCTYCQFPALFRFKYRSFSTERIIEEMALICRDASRRGKERVFVNLWDDDLSADHDRLVELCRKMTERSLELDFAAELRADNVDPELLSLLRGAGMSDVYFGLESANPGTLRRINRIGTIRCADQSFAAEREYLERIRAAVSMAKKENIRTSVSIMVGLPGETLEDVHRTLDFVKSLDVDKYSHNVLWVMKGTRLWKRIMNGEEAIKIIEPDMPYRFFSTRYAFDVYKVKRLPHAIRMQNADPLPEVLSGTFAFDEQWSGKPRYVIFRGARAIADETYRWIGDEVPLSSSMFLLHHDITWDDVKSVMNRAYRVCGVGAINFHGIQVLHSADLETRSIPPAEEMTSRIIIAGYSELFDNASPFSAAGMDGTGTVARLRSVEDIEMAARHSARLRMGLPVAKHLFDRRVIVADQCRWSNRIFPCRGLQRADVGGDDSIRPCRDAEPIGTVGDYYRCVVDRLEAAYRTECDARDCDACRIRGSCSRCPFPYPMKRDLYCRIRLEHPDLDRWLSLLQALIDVSPGVLDGNGDFVTISSTPVLVRRRAGLDERMPSTSGGNKKRVPKDSISFLEMKDGVAVFDCTARSTTFFDSNACKIAVAAEAGLDRREIVGLMNAWFDTPVREAEETVDYVLGLFTG